VYVYLTSNIFKCKDVVHGKKVIDMDLVFIAPLIAIVAMVTAGILFWWVKKQSTGTKKMEEIARITKGLI